MDIRLESVCKAFGGQKVLQNVSFHITDGQGWRINGASGIGKTTLLRVLMGLETIDTGSITGREGVCMSAAFQDHRLCSWLSARQNMRLVCGAEITDAQIDATLLRLLPAQCLDQPADALSGGMQRRVALARAFLPPSELVLLDEPFAGLDDGNVAIALDFVQDMRQGRAVVLVSHEDHIPLNAYQTLQL